MAEWTKYYEIHIGEVAAAPPVEGPNTWYYSGPGTDTFESSTAMFASNEYGNQITCTEAGSITKISFKMASGSGDPVKVWLGKDKSGTTWTKHEIGTVSSHVTGWNDFTLSTPLSVSAGTIVLVVVDLGNYSGYNIAYNSGYDGHWADSKTYGTWDPATITWSADAGYGYGMRVYVD